jgi:hypothetical protein
MNTKTLSWLAFCVMAMGLVLMIYFFITSKSEANQCLTSPMVYGIKQIEQANEAQFMCTCTLDKPNSPTVYLSDKGINVTSSYSSYAPNLSTLFNLTK